MATGTGHFPGGAPQALEGQCLAIPTHLSLHTKHRVGKFWGVNLLPQAHM